MLFFAKGADKRMIGKELKKLSRRELVDIIYQMKKNEEQMQEEITSLQEALQDKRIRLSMAGSIADAAASVTNVFNAAQMTADLYLNEISCMKEETRQECNKMLEEAHATVEKIFDEGKKRFAELSDRYRAEYEKLQMLREEIQLLEERKTHDSCED
jgi:chromosome condensin MukBEF complex kleisin-like MukF subunit